MYARIVVPLDGSAVAARALPIAEHLARLAEAPLHLVGVVDVTRFDRYGPYAVAVSATAFAQAVAEEETAARAYLEPVARELADRGLVATVETRHGPAARELVGLA